MSPPDVPRGPDTLDAPDDGLGMDAATLQRALKLVYQYTGITLAEGKKTMLQSRMRQRMRQLGLPSYRAYLDWLENTPAERQPFIDVVTTHQTTFFRTPKVWDYFREQFLPHYLHTHGTDSVLRLWSAAASTGEEACSIAMCCEEFKRQHPRFNYDILATDISTEVLAQAQQGEYTGATVTHFRTKHPELFARYNHSSLPERFALPKALHQRIRFQPCNLMLPQQPWKEHFDLVFLRNVLIYFSLEDARRIVQRLAPTLRHSGQLIIGESESLSGQEVPFQFIQPQVYRRSQQ